MTVAVSPPAPTIDPGVSSYLDLMRISAALTVVASHMVHPFFGVYSVPGNDAVILFFVISGFVIAYVCERRDFTLDRYVLSRVARLWSVLLPSLLLSALAAVLVGHRATVEFAPAIDAPLPFLWASLRTALFLGENWSWLVPAPYNDPTWSLNYEAWYYTIFAAFVFSPRRWRWLAAGAASVAAGPAILALMPCWLLGAWLYYRRDAMLMRSGAAYALFAACVALYAAAYVFDLNTASRHWLSLLTQGQSYRLRTSTAMIGDAMLACLCGASIVAVRSMGAVNRVLARFSGLTRGAASRTFSIYLFHMPIFAILFGRFGLGQDVPGGALLCYVTVLGLCVLLGGITEARLPAWRRALWGLYVASQRLRRRPPAPSPTTTP